MKILFGLNNNTHSEIARSEIDAFRKFGVETDSCPYGNWGVTTNLVGSFALVLKNAFLLKKKAAFQGSNVIYLNTALDLKALIRDSITIFILKISNRNLKIVLKFHGSDISTLLSKFNLLKKYVFSKANLLLVLSNEERSNFLTLGIPMEKVRVTANVIDKSLYKKDFDFRRKMNVGENTNILLFVGRFIKEKGILDIVLACKYLKEANVDFKIFCLGDGPLFSKVNKLIHAYDMDENVLLLGHIPEADTRYYYSNCDLLVLPTYHQEGFPMAVFQAVGAGKPVITTKIRAAADYFVENENCLWVERENPGQLRQKIEMLLVDSSLRCKMGQRNLLLADQFSPEKIVGNLNEYFKVI